MTMYFNFSGFNLPVKVIAAGLVVLLFIRILHIVFDIYKNRNNQVIYHDRERPIKTMVVLGSGGHTAEMVLLLSGLGEHYSPFIYVMSDSDNTSLGKLQQMNSEHMCVIRIPRSREVLQSWLSTIWTTANALLHSLFVVWHQRPDLILCNGPGTCIPVCVSGLFLGVVGFRRPQVVFVESVCRVQSLSLTGKILYFLADAVLVQWPQLQKKYPAVTYLGRLT